MKLEHKPYEPEVLRDASVEEAEIEHGLREVVQTMAPEASADVVEAAVDALAVEVIPLEHVAQDLLADIKRKPVQVESDAKIKEFAVPDLFSAPGAGMDLPGNPDDPTPYLFSAIRSGEEQLGGGGAPGGGPPRPPGGSGGPPSWPPADDNEDAEDELDEPADDVPDEPRAAPDHARGMARAGERARAKPEERPPSAPPPAKAASSTSAQRPSGPKPPKPER